MSQATVASPRRVIGIVSLVLVVGGILGAVLFKSSPEFRAEASPSGKGKAGPRSGPAKPIPVEILTLTAEAFAVPVPATGTLMPKESVALVSEVSRRLVRIHAKEGERVEKGAVLFELDAQDARAEHKRLTIQLNLAKRTAERQTELLRESVGSAAEADQATTAVANLEATLHAVDVELNKSVIRAPFSGVLGLRQVSEGAWVTPNTPLITLEDTSELKVDFQIPERHARAVKPGGAFSLQIEGQPQALTGHVIATEPSIKSDSRSLSVRGLVAASDGLVPGMFAKVELPVQISDALLVPAIVVLPGVLGRSVFVEQDGKAKQISVELGPRTPDRIQVVSGLKAGDRVIVSNLLRLKDGAPVQVLKSEP